MPFSAQMGKKKSKARGAPSSSASVAAAAVSQADITNACRVRDLVKLRRWGRQGVRVTNAEPLLIAVKGGNLEVLRCLVTDLGADVNHGDANGNTPLHFAALDNILDVIRCLVTEYSADVSQANHGGGTPLLIAAQKGYLDIVRCLVAEFGADVNQAMHEGATPLYIAVQNGHMDIVRCLVAEFGADVNQAMHEGATPLYIAVQNGHMDIVRCLLSEFGADVNQSKHDGATPLMVAANRNDQALMKHLVHKGAHVRAVATSGETAITVLKAAEATAAQIAYLEVRECCATPGCDGGGRKRCCVCKETRYCGMACRVAHWRVHRGGCRPPIDAGGEGSGGAS
jgi:ankyrin repeat protein